MSVWFVMSMLLPQDHMTTESKNDGGSEVLAYVQDLGDGLSLDDFESY